MTGVTGVEMRAVYAQTLIELAERMSGLWCSKRT